MHAHICVHLRYRFMLSGFHVENELFKIDHTRVYLIYFMFHINDCYFILNWFASVLLWSVWAAITNHHRLSE